MELKLLENEATRKSNKNDSSATTSRQTYIHKSQLSAITPCPKSRPPSAHTINHFIDTPKAVIKFLELNSTHAREQLELYSAIYEKHLH